jgi:hypothetical protein
MPRSSVVTKLLVAASCVAASVAIYLLFFRNAPDERIRAQLGRLTQAVEVDPSSSENPLARLGRIRGEFKEVFVEDVTIEIPELPSLTSGRIALADVVAQAPQAYSSAHVDLASVRITFDASKKSADVTAIATLSGARPGTEQTRDVRRVVFRLDLVDGDWRISRLQVAPSDEPR